jgi:D-mannonate dehydratase
MINAFNKVMAKLEQLPEAEQEKIAQEILEKLKKYPSLSKKDKEQTLSEFLRLPELEEDEALFERDQETVREINL